MCFIQLYALVKSNAMYIKHKIINAFSILILYLSMYLKTRLNIHLYPMELQLQCLLTIIEIMQSNILK